MAITMTGASAATEMLRQFQEKVEYETVRALSYLGEQCVNMVRDRSAEASWIDQTGNLRSSIGYIISKNGEIVTMSNFKTVKNGADGSAKGKQYAIELANKYRGHYVLIVVAGMNYAEYVEAKGNKDVLGSTELWAKTESVKMLQKLKDKLLKL